MLASKSATDKALASAADKDEDEDEDEVVRPVPAINPAVLEETQVLVGCCCCIYGVASHYTTFSWITAGRVLLLIWAALWLIFLSADYSPDVASRATAKQQIREQLKWSSWLFYFALPVLIVWLPSCQPVTSDTGLNWFFWLLPMNLWLGRRSDKWAVPNPWVRAVVYRALTLILLYLILLLCGLNALQPFLMLWPSIIVVVVAILSLIPNLDVGQKFLNSYQRRWRMAFLGLLTAISITIALAPGQLQCYPLSDFGFHQTVGTEWQNWALTILQQPTSQIARQARYPKHTFFIAETAWPSSLLRCKPAEVSLEGDGAQRYLKIVWGRLLYRRNGFVFTQQRASLPKLTSSASPRGSVRLMWPGVFSYQQDAA